jgi:hypothetical protein
MNYIKIMWKSFTNTLVDHVSIMMKLQPQWFVAEMVKKVAYAVAFIMIGMNWSWIGSIVIVLVLGTAINIAFVYVWLKSKNHDEVEDALFKAAKIRLEKGFI